MQVYTYDLVAEKNGTLTLKNLPFNEGDKLQLIVIPHSKPKCDNERYPFLSKPIPYIDSTDSISAQDDALYRIAMAVEEDERLNTEMGDWDVVVNDSVDRIQYPDNPGDLR